jgi:hypothetical protein
MSRRYVIRHNGMTSFVPPCFCWSAHRGDGLDITFSDIDASQIDDLAVATAIRQWIVAPGARGLEAEGDVESYDVPVPSGALPGMRFVVHLSHGFV